MGSRRIDDCGDDAELIRADSEWLAFSVLREIQEAYLALPSVRAKIGRHGWDCPIRWAPGKVPTYRDVRSRPLPAWEAQLRESIRKEPK